MPASSSVFLLRSARIERRVHRTLAPSGLSQPAALWLFGPSAVGKSFMRDASAFELFGSPENAVEVDGARISAGLSLCVSA